MVYRGYYPVFAVVCPNLSGFHLALEMYTEVMMPAYPIDLEQALSVVPLLGRYGLDR